MMRDSATKQRTKLRLIEGGAAVFSEKAYRDATVAGICQRAGANIAAVNYHFGSKEGLYEVVWDSVLEFFESAYPPPGDSAPPREVIALFIRHRAFAIFDPGKGGWLPRILHRQMGDPIAETVRLAEKYLRPRKQRVLAAIGSLLQENPDSAIVKSCFINVLAPMIMLSVHRRARRELFGEGPPTSAQLSAAADQFTAFALGGIDALAPKKAQ